MNRPRVSRKVILLVFSWLSMTPAFAILGIGDVVFDPTNYEEAVRQLLQMEQQYEQLVRTYQTIRSQYDQMVWMARRVPVDMMTRYRAQATPWRMPSTADTYGTLAAWTSAMNSGSGAQAAYAQATRPLSSYGAALGRIPADQLDRLKANYATVELTDGASVNTLDLVGRFRGNATAVESAIQGLELDSLSADPTMNTQIAVLNKINAGTMIGLRNGQDTNKLLVALAEQHLIEAKRKRDAEAQAINDHIRFMAGEEDILNAQARGSSQAMLAWKMP